ncbi:M15 family metallopeptidase [Amnibacterium endophyticum]|uniref:M15 family metallopeptidase n=1 Tax=Amnibacterium endophyticum TaxID=2109337 RepID=A0ABW4LHY8_9MICO
MCAPSLSRRTALGAAVVLPLTAALSACSTGPSTPTRTAATATAAPHPSPSDLVPARTTRTTPDLDAPGSLAVVVDKRRPLSPRSWVPRDLVAPDVRHTNAPQLRRPAARALERMFDAADGDGVVLVSLSAYRPYTVQRRIYERNLGSIGRAATEKLTLRPGYSEHQTGLAIDLGGASRTQDLSVAFAGTDAAAWLRAHAWRHGFILRYERGRKPVTGIQYEPWHYRYLGKPRAADYHASGAHTLEQYFGLPAAPGYR